MKTIATFLMIVLFLSATMTTDALAKPADCLSALRQCASQCRETFGDWNPLSDACEFGCAIGYLYC